MDVDATKFVFDSNTLFQTFEANDYITASFGKLTNNMASFFCNFTNETHAPGAIFNGFSRVRCPCDFNNYYGKTYVDKFINGSFVKYSINQNENAYETSMIGNGTMDWLNSDEMIKTDKAMFLWWAPHR